jgi:hypothetical protein
MNSTTALFFLAFATLYSCNKAEKLNETVTTPTTEVAEQKPVTECYIMATPRDTVTMTMTRQNQSVSGDLRYNWYEKDHNVGTYKGSFMGDTLRIGYTFQSEGMTSIREELFLLKGDELIKGTGHIIEKNGRQVFENKKNVIFDGSIVLTKTDCKN